MEGIIALDHTERTLFMQIAGNINKMITNLRLKELGELEQDLIFGGAGIKDVIKFFKINEVRTCRRFLLNACCLFC